MKALAEVTAGGMNESARTLVAELSVVVDAWEQARRAAEAARGHRDMVEARATVAVEAALGGMPLRRWRRLVNGEVSIRSRADGRDINLARRRGVDVQVCLTELEAVRMVEAAKVEEAERNLASATRRLLAYGTLAERFTARPTVDLRQMALRSGDRRGTPRFATDEVSRPGCRG